MTFEIRYHPVTEEAIGPWETIGSFTAPDVETARKTFEYDDILEDPRYSFGPIALFRDNEIVPGTTCL